MKTRHPDTVQAPSGILYQINKPLIQTQNFRLYRVVSESFPGQVMILKIVTDKNLNHLLEKEAFTLKSMSEEADVVENEYSENHPGKTLNYQIGFPKLIDNFLSPENENRRILVLTLTMSESLSGVVPINMITEQDKVRIDPKTSVWILGKFLKIIAFAHDRMMIAVGNLSSENIFIIRKDHLISIFDWSQVVFYSSGVPHEVVNDELRKAVQVVIVLLGGDPKTGTIPDHEQLEGEGANYRLLLKSLLTKDFESVYDAHLQFYEVVEEIWERKYHPFTEIPLT